jgi:hypothetical protein
MKQEFDFGFSLIDEDELRKLEASLQEELSASKMDMRDKLMGLKQLYQPLLDNLKRDPEKAIIRWPNRLDKIKQFETKIDEYIQLCVKSS